MEESKVTFNNIESLISGVEAGLEDSNLEKMFNDAMNDDLNTPKFLGDMNEYINKNKNGNHTQFIKTKSTIKYLFEILGFVFEDKEQKVDIKLLENILTDQNIQIENDINVSINKFIAKRNEYRNNKEFDKADYMRNRLDEIGIVIEDGNESGWRWKNS